MASREGDKRSRGGGGVEVEGNREEGRRGRKGLVGSGYKRGKSNVMGGRRCFL